MRSHPVAAVLLVLVLLPGCVHPSKPRPDAALDRLLDLIRQRLLVMDGVARWKWNQQASIADPVRERAILEGIVAQSGKHDLDPAFVRIFFQAQFDAAKQVQADCFRRWEAARQPPFPDAPDLTRDLRPQIDRLNGELLAALPAVRLQDPAARGRLQQRAAVVVQGDGITAAVRDTAVAPLLAP